MHSLSRSLSEEVAEWPRVDVFSVAPGFVDTDLARELFGSAAQSSKILDKSRSRDDAPGASSETFSRRSSFRRCCRCPPVATADDVASSALRQLGSGWSCIRPLETLLAAFLNEHCSCTDPVRGNVAACDVGRRCDRGKRVSYNSSHVNADDGLADIDELWTTWIRRKWKGTCSELTALLRN